MGIYEKSEPNNDFVKKILLNPMTSNWESQNHSPYTLTEVNEDSDEFQKVKEDFNNPRRIIRKLERVENPYLLAQYLLKKQKLEINGSVEELNLFHGTNKDCVESICKTNFNWRLKKRSMYGQGIFFAACVNYAIYYTTDGTIIRAKVLIGESIVGNEGMSIPPEGYDTTTNAAEGVYAKYEDDDFYPEYIIHYDQI